MLGAIIIVASLGLLDVPAFASCDKVGPVEFWLAVVTLFGVLTVGILQGILVAVMLSLINVIYHISRPHDALLDDVDASGGTVYRGVTDKETALTEPGLIVYRFDAPLVFANAAFFTERLEALVANAGTGLKCVILDAEAISDFDSTAAEALENLDADLERLGVELWIARANEPLRDLLQVTGLTKRLGQREHLSVRARRGGSVPREVWYRPLTSDPRYVSNPHLGSPCFGRGLPTPAPCRTYGQTHPQLSSDTRNRLELHFPVNHPDALLDA